MQKATSTKVLAFGWYGAENTGDEWLLSTLLRWVRGLGGELTVISVNPTRTRERHGVSAIGFDDYPEIARVLMTTDLFVMGGGGVFQDYGPFRIPALYTPVANDISSYARPYYMARQFGVPTLIWAHGVGPLRSEDARQIVSDVFEQADFVTVRDPASASLLKQCGVHRSIVSAPDPTWAALPVAVDWVPAGFSDIKALRKVALIVREWEYFSGWENQLLQALRQALPRDCACVWIGFQSAPEGSGVASDRPFLERLHEAFGNTGNGVVLDGLDITEVAAVLSRCDAVVAMRLHGLILSLAMGKPTLSYEYDEKLGQAAASAGLPERFRISLGAPAEQLADAVRSLLTRGAEWGVTVEVAELTRLADVHRQELMSAMSSAGIRKQRVWHSDNFDWLSLWGRNGPTHANGDAATVAAGVLERQHFNPYELLSRARPIPVDVIERHYEKSKVMVPFSCVMTVRNEAQSIFEFLAVLARQDALPEEVIVVDGGSSDGTVAEIKKAVDVYPVPLRLILAGDVNIATGRNIGIHAARQEIVLLVDAGCRMRPDFSTSMLGPFAEIDDLDLVAGIYRPSASKAWEDRFIYNWEGAIDWADFLPSARAVCIRKALWTKAGGFPEYLTLTGEDTLFDLRYRRHSRRWLVNKHACVIWDMPLLPEQAEQLAYHYGYGDGESGVGDFEHYDHLVSARRTRGLQIANASVRGYLDGRLRRGEIEVRRRGIRKVVLILSGVPFTDSGGGQRCSQLAIAFAEREVKVVFVNVYPSFEQKRKCYFDLDYTLFEFYGVRDFDTEEFVRSYASFEDVSVMSVIEFPHPDFLPVVRQLKQRLGTRMLVVYDYIDNWRSSLGWEWYSETAEAAVVAEADALMASAVTLQADLTARTDRQVFLLPNAVNGRLFDPVLTYPRPDDLPSGKIVLYTGALWGEWFDWDLLLGCVDRLPDVQFVLIGGLDASRAATLQAGRGNLCFIGLKPQSVLPAYLAHADVCVIPFKVDHITTYVSPLKVYEYLSMHKPVVATALPELVDMPGVVLADTPDRFLGALEKSLTQDSDDIDAVKDFVCNNTWQARLCALEKMLGISLPMPKDLCAVPDVGISPKNQAENLNTSAQDGHPDSDPVPPFAFSEESDSKVRIAWQMLESQAKALRAAELVRQELTTKLHEAEHGRQELEVRFESLSNVHSRTVKKLDWMAGQLQAGNQHRTELVSSYSWRIGAPVRFCLRLVRHGLLPSDRAWLESYLRAWFHRLALSTSRKEQLFHFYGRLFGYPKQAPLPSQVGHRLTLVRETASGMCAGTEAEDALEFVAPDVWAHHARPYGVLCLPIIEWSFRFQRPQQMARRFAAAGHEVLYVSSVFADQVALIDLEHGVSGMTLPGPVNTNVYQNMPTDAHVQLMVEAVLQYIRSMPARTWVCIVQLPFWGPVADKLRLELKCPIVYDCMDDHSGFSTNGKTMLVAEGRLLQGADLVVASSQVLLEKAECDARKVVLVRNAVDYEHFSSVPRTRHDLPRRVVGYYGAIADWFDSELVAAMARARPEWQYVLIGSTYCADTAPLLACINITLVGEKPYVDLPALIAEWDCCLIPFKRVPLTEATNPVKVYEMLAAGKPVVAVSLPELLPLAAEGHIALADTADAFVAAVEREVAEDGVERQDARRRYARSNTWEVRQNQLDQAVRGVFPLVSVIIVTYNNLPLNKLCLESVLQDTDYPNFEVVVVDNASSDETPSYLSKILDPRVRVVLNPDNRGFAAANNQGLSLAHGDYLCLLNNDTVVSGTWLSTLVEHLRRDSELGLVGPVTNAIGNEARISVGYILLSDMPAWAEVYCAEHRGRLDDIPMLAFFCVAIPRVVIEKVGMLDERFGIGMFEDDDYNRRVREAGYKIKLAHDAYIHHWQCASFKVLGEAAYYATYRENEKRYRAKWARSSLSNKEAKKLEPLFNASKASRGTVVFAPSIGWDIHLFQRPHHLAKVLAQDGYTVVFDCSNSNDAVDLLHEIEPSLFLYNGESEWLVGLTGTVLWTFAYNYDYRDRFDKDIPVVYDWIDDLTVFPHDQQILARLHGRAMKEATLVASVARRLHDQAVLDRPDALYLPNAVEEGRFDRAPEPNPARLDHEFARLLDSGCPIAGYYGALARWFDYDLLAATARLRPDWNFVLIGPDHDGSIGQSGILKVPNITCLGPREYQTLPGYLHLFDVAIIPFKINEITIATSPLKLFEYFAAGRPIVTSPMPECMAFPEVTIAADADAFADALDVARQARKEAGFVERLAKLARENSWRARAHAALSALAQNQKDAWTIDRRIRTRERFSHLRHAGNRYFFAALANHLAPVQDDELQEMYFRFALSANDRGRETARILAKRVSLAGKRHLDVGCSTGGFLVAFAEAGADTMGFDLDPLGLALADQNFLDFGRPLPTAIRDLTQEADVSDYEGVFDIVTCNDVIEHVVNPARAIRHISRMLRPDGFTYLEIPNKDAVEFVIRDGHYQLFGITQLDRDDAASYFAASSPGTKYGVEYYFSLPEYRALMAAEGLEMEVLAESLTGVGMESTLAAVGQLESSFDEYLRQVPGMIRKQVEGRVRRYLERVRNAQSNCQDDESEFLVTYGASFWKVIAKKVGEPGTGPTTSPAVVSAGEEAPVDWTEIGGR